LWEGKKEIGGLARLTGGVENRAAVGFQNGQPVRQIVGMAHLRNNAQMRAHKGAGQFGDEFFARIGRRAKAPG